MTDVSKLDYMTDDEVMQELVRDMGELNETLRCLAERGYKVEVEVIDQHSISQAHATPVVTASVFEQKL